MGRKKKLVEVDETRFENMERERKLEIFNDFNALFHYELSRIEKKQIEISVPGKAEDVVQKHFEQGGFQVFRSSAKNGYRTIGTEFYWRNYAGKLTERARMTVEKIRSVLSPDEFRQLAYAVKEKSGTPDLLLIRNGLISFVEVKSNYETVKASTLRFWIEYGSIWPISIFRVIQKKPSRKE